MRISTPSMTASRRIKELRQKKGWSAAKLAAACAEYGLPELNRSVIANIESRRRKTVTLEEATTLAYVLDVSLLHLIVPTDDEDQFEFDLYRLGDDVISFDMARGWIRGDVPLPGQDPRVYYSEVPRDDFRVDRPSKQQIQEQAEDVAFYREMLAKTGFFDRTDGDEYGVDSEES